MSDTPRLTPQAVAVIRALLQTPTTPRWGRDIGRETGLKSGSLYPILARLEQAGWVESHWEEADVVERGRPRRRYHQLTPGGLAANATLAAQPPGGGSMTSYVVTWVIDVDADSPQGAAQRAWDLMHRPGSEANVFTVTDPGGAATEVDLMAEAAG